MQVNGKSGKLPLHNHRWGSLKYWLHRSSWHSTLWHISGNMDLRLPGISKYKNKQVLFWETLRNVLPTYLDQRTSRRIGKYWKLQNNQIVSFVHKSKCCRRTPLAERDTKWSILTVPPVVCNWTYFTPPSHYAWNMCGWEHEPPSRKQSSGVTLGAQKNQY